MRRCDVGEDATDAGDRVAGLDERAHIAAADEVQVPGSHAEATKRLGTFARESPGSRKSEETTQEPGDQPVMGDGSGAIASRDLDHCPVEMGEDGCSSESGLIHIQVPVIRTVRSSPIRRAGQHQKWTAPYGLDLDGSAAPALDDGLTPEIAGRPGRESSAGPRLTTPKCPKPQAGLRADLNQL